MSSDSRSIAVSTTVESRLLRSTTDFGLKAWEALLNEILDLRRSELGNGTDAYRFLKDVEGLVLPTWQIHGKQLLADSGVDPATLQAQGMPVAEIEKLYQAVYAFAFGFSRVIKNSTKLCKDGGRTLVQNISGLYSTLLAEALEQDFHDLISLLFSEKDEKILELERERNKLQTSILILQSDLALSQERGAQCSQDLARAEASAAAPSSSRARTGRRG